MKKDENALNRRQFGKIVAGGVGALTVGAAAVAQEREVTCAPLEGTPTDLTKTVDVVIVGAGLSGLIASRELRKLNKTVIILEANDRIGGRMYGRETKPITNGNRVYRGYLDYGGQWVGDTQYEMQALVDELKIEPFISYEKGRGIRRFDGVRTAFSGDVSTLLKGRCGDYDLEGVKGCDDAPTPVMGKCPDDELEHFVWGKLLDTASMVIGDRPWKTENAANLDAQTFEEALVDWTKESKMPGGTPWWPTMQAHIGGSGGFEPGQVSTLHMAWTQNVGPQAETPERWLLYGGAGQIPGKLENDPNPKLRPTIVTNTRVTEIKDTKTDGVHVIGTNVKSGDGWGKNTTYKCKAVIVAIPPWLRQCITFTDVAPVGRSMEPYMKFSEGAPMGSMAKVHIVYKTAFWRDKCLSGSTAGNLGRKNDDIKLLQFVADSSPPSAEPGILTSFIAADVNEELTEKLAVIAGELRHKGLKNDVIQRMIQETVQGLVIEDLVRYFGNDYKDDLTDVQDFVYWNWDTKQYTGGAFTAYVKPGVWTEYGEIGWREPVGNVFWAGTETAERWPGYFDGAVRAGKAAAARVLAKHHWPTAHAPAAPKAAAART